MTDQAYLTRKLKHYNEWLLDNTREFGKPYPGFPEDQKAAKRKTSVIKETPVVAPVKRKKGKSVMKIETVGIKAAKIARAPKAGTKQAKAIEIVRTLGVGAKADAIAKIMSDLSMSKAGATTYFHNARNALATEAR